jgi:cyclic pyranopterin phosphate synthase
MRITADGKLRPCLLSPVEIDLKGPLRAGADDKELTELLKEGIKRKPYAHGMVRDFPRDRAMSEIGG